MFPLTPRRLARVAAAVVVLSSLAANGEEPAKSYSGAERAIFMTDQLAKVRPPVTLHYRFHHAGSLEAGFDDTVSVALKAKSGGGCCDASGAYLSGEHRIELPPVEGVAGNPVTLFFLERDVREMQRLTSGKSPYFRKRIRMAIFEGAQQRNVTMRYRGKTVAGEEYTIAPYVDDPNRSRFERFANKRYVFTLSSAVPGGVYAIRSMVAGDAATGADAPPLLADELLIDGADATSIKASS